MIAGAPKKFALRPYLPEDAEILAAIFRASIEDLTAEDYNPAQQEAWAAAAEDEQAFADRLGKQLTLLATHDGEPVGFASLADNKVIDMLYVHPAVAGQGAGSLLIDALEKLAAARGARELTVDASDSAREFFQARGFTPEQRNSISVGNEWLSNTTMKKKLAQQRSA